VSTRVPGQEPVAVHVGQHADGGARVSSRASTSAALGFWALFSATGNLQDIGRSLGLLQRADLDQRGAVPVVDDQAAVD